MRPLLAIAILTLASWGHSSEPAPLANGTVGLPYRERLLWVTGQGSTGWTLTHGALPDGLSLNSVSGVVSGTPVKAGKYNFTIGYKEPAPSPARKTRELSILIALPGVRGGGTTRWTGTYEYRLELQVDDAQARSVARGAGRYAHTV